MPDLPENLLTACKKIVSDGLDLCVRARKLDAQDRTADTLSASADPDEWVSSGGFERYAAAHNSLNPDCPILPKPCGTVALWVQEQYEHDLADWENRARTFLTQHPMEIEARDA